MTVADIHSEIRLLTDTDTTSYTNAQILIRLNSSYEQVVGWIINADGTWQFDDTNYSTHPRGRGNLVQGQEDYAFAAEYLQIEAVEILNTNTQYKRINPLDHQELGGLSPQEYFGVTAAGDPATGFPEYYDINGDTIRLYRAPTSTLVTLTNGLRVWFKRTADIFTSAQVTTGTKEPGFASPYHIILCYMVAVSYCMAYKKDRIALYEKKVGELKDEIIKHYSHKQKDWRPVMTMKSRPYR